MVTSDAWRVLTPLFDTSLSSGLFAAQGAIFAIANSVITATQLDLPHRQIHMRSGVKIAC
jgi:hypothetical protein